MKMIKSMAVYVLAVLAGFVVAETVYRVKLIRKHDARLEMRPQRIEDLPPITAFTRSLWEYDEAEGFQYASRAGVYSTLIRHGASAGCSLTNPINRYGGTGVSEGDYKSAKLKIAVFGDSFTAFVDGENFTWVNLLQRRLEQKTGMTAHVLNFGRDGIGLAQMFDVAASKVPQVHPDLAIIAFNTVQASAVRIWRSALQIVGEHRVITSTRPDQPPDLSDHNHSYDTTILHAGVNTEWCSRPRDVASDRVAAEIVDRYRRFRPLRYSVFDLKRSFLLQKILNGDAFVEGVGPGVTPPAGSPTSETVANDPLLRQSIERLSTAGIPFLLVHLPVSDEVRAGADYVDRKAIPVIRAFEKASGREVVELRSMFPPIERPEQMNITPTDRHPTRMAMELYANAVAEKVLLIVHKAEDMAK